MYNALYHMGAGLSSRLNHESPPPSLRKQLADASCRERRPATGGLPGRIDYDIADAVLAVLRQRIEAAPIGDSACAPAVAAERRRVLVLLGGDA
jgi:hypothetical protein